MWTLIIVIVLSIGFTGALYGAICAAREIERRDD